MPRRGFSLAVLIVNQLLAGVGVATGMALAAILTADLTGVLAMGGLAQSSSVLGAAIVAVPLARLAVRSGRNVALATGYAPGERRCRARDRRGLERHGRCSCSSASRRSERAPRRACRRGSRRPRWRRPASRRARCRSCSGPRPSARSRGRCSRRPATRSASRSGCRRSWARSCSRRSPSRVVAASSARCCASRRRGTSRSTSSRRRMPAGVPVLATGAASDSAAASDSPRPRPAAGTRPARRRDPPAGDRDRRSASAPGRPCASPCANPARSSRSSRSCARRPS